MKAVKILHTKEVTGDEIVEIKMREKKIPRVSYDKIAFEVAI
ncbi:MAG: hypothetical protein AAB332_05990 [Planctomycetota bacterium]